MFFGDKNTLNLIFFKLKFIDKNLNYFCILKSMDLDGIC
jgi:hypothetical protein